MLFGKYLHKTGHVLREIIQYGSITYCTLQFGGDICMCTGPSMKPTIYNGDLVLIERVSPRLQWLKKGDIIIAKNPSDPKQHICKRIQGLPGDIIRLESMIHIVPLGHVWLEGDNSRNSIDSRTYGSIPQGLIDGRVLFRIWPLSKMSLLVAKSV